MKPSVMVFIGIFLMSIGFCLMLSTFRSTAKYTSSVQVLDSCEYVVVKNITSIIGITHKGNCKFCAERHKKDIKENIDSLFMMQE